MKTLLAAVMLMFSGCQMSGTATENRSVCKYTDKATGVVCYFNCYFTHQSGISCVKVEGQR